MWLVLAFIIVVILLWLWSERAGELFCLSSREGKTLLVRGRIPQGLLNDLHEALIRQKVPRATLRAVRTPQGLSLKVSGELDEFQAQRLRNILQTYPVSRFSLAPAVEQRGLGSLLGLVWLVWLLDGGRGTPET